MSAFGGPEINDSGLILHLDASNTKSYPGSGTTWFDLIDQANNGTLINGVGFNSINGGSLTFNGSNQRVSTNFKPSGARSYFIWVRYNTINSLPNGYSLTGTQQVNAFNYLGISNGGYFYYYAGTTGNQLNSVLLNANTWYQQGFVLNADGSRTLYLNGLAVGSEAGGVGGTATSEFSIGCVNQNHWVNGSIPVVTQYNRALTSSEVLQNYNATRSRFQTPTEVKAGLILDLDAGNTSSYSGSGTTWTDLSGSGYNATISGSPTFTSSGSGSYFTINNGVTNQFMQASVPKPNLPVTLSFWVYPLSANRSLFDTAPNTQNVFRLVNGTVEWWNVDPGISTTADTPINNWYNMTFVYDYTGNRRLSFYLNGRLVQTATGSTTSTYAWSTFIIGNVNNTGAGVFSGRVAKAAIYNRALSALEIGTNFDALRGRYGL